MNIIMSACLLGQFCRYDGKTKEYSSVLSVLQEKNIHIIPVCPEQMGGLATPREAAERRGAAVVTVSGTDVTSQYIRGAEQTAQLAERMHCHWAVLKEKSPSCGAGKIYDGSFTRCLVDGDGMTAALLKKRGIRVVGENDRDGFEQLIKLARNMR